MSTHPLGSHALVTIQFMALAFVLYPFGNSPNNLLWLSLSALGGLLAIYTLLHNRLGNFGVYPEPVEGAQLITSGPYRWIRHPMYSSLLLLMAGIAIYNNHPWNVLASGVLLLALLGKIHKEERYLSSQFPGYSAYCQRSKRLLPYLY